MCIDIKDKKSLEAARKTIELVKKYNRYQSTVLGGSSNAVSKKLIRSDQKIATFFGKEDVLLLIFGLITRTLPYLHFDRELAALPYLTLDYMNE